PLVKSQREKTMITVLLVDDQPAVRQGLRMLFALEPGFTVVGEAGGGTVALEMAKVLHPQVVVMDVEMPDMDGLTATTRLRKIAPQSAVVVLTLYDDAVTRTRAKIAGAAEFVARAWSPEASTR